MFIENEKDAIIRKSADEQIPAASIRTIIVLRTNISFLVEIHLKRKLLAKWELREVFIKTKKMKVWNLFKGGGVKPQIQTFLVLI